MFFTRFCRLTDRDSIDVFVGNIDFGGGIGDFAPICRVDGQSVDVDVAAGVRSLGGAAPIAAGDLELDALHLSVLGGLDQTCAAYRVCFYLDVAAYRLPAIRIIGGKVLLGWVTGLPNGYSPFTAS